MPAREQEAQELAQPDLLQSGHHAEEETPTETTPTEGATLADVLVDSLTAQSLDLPPQAARWRQQQRGDAFKQHQLLVFQAADASWDSDDEPDQPAGITGERIAFGVTAAGVQGSS